MQRHDMGTDDNSLLAGVSHFINSSPLGERTGAPPLVSLDTRLLSGSLIYPSSSSGYHTAVDRTWDAGAYIHSTGIGNFPAPSASASTTGLRPRSAADGGLDHHHLGYFDSYHDRPPTFHSTTQSSPISDAYTYGVVPSSLLLQPDTSSQYLPTSQLGTSYLQENHSSLSSLPNAPGVSNSMGHIDMTPSQQHASGNGFYSQDGLYSSLGQNSARQQQGRENAATTLRPSLSFTLPGMPSAEEAFLTHIHQSTTSMNDVGIEEPLPGDPRRDLLILPSSYQHQSLDFGNDNTSHHQDIERNLYHTHIGTGSPSSSESSRSSQKRAREDPDVLPSTGLESSALSVASPVIKRQRLDDIADGLSGSTSNSRGRRSQARQFGNSGPYLWSDEDADEDDFFDSGNDDSDGYIPSRSPSPIAPTLVLTTPSPPASTTDEYLPPSAKGKGGRRRGKGKGKAKGSAARALAMITKVREQQDIQERAEFGTEFSGGGGEDASYYRISAGGASEGEGSNRNSTPAQASAPVPNLTKKSRGRKVPYVAAFRGGEGIGEGIPVSGIVTMSPSGRRGKRRATAVGGAGTMLDGFQAQVLPTGEDRSFVCVVPGCGKCFVRGEHLKRHVRSIHTDDKPFLCPHKGCGKSFSRRDNLGQHVRIHLNN